MPGVKGQRWGHKQPRKIQKSVSLDQDVYNDVEKMADENRWTISSTISYIVETYFKK